MYICTDAALFCIGLFIYTRSSIRVHLRKSLNKNDKNGEALFLLLSVSFTPPFSQCLSIRLFVSFSLFLDALSMDIGRSLVLLCFCGAQSPIKLIGSACSLIVSRLKMEGG